MGRGSLGHRTPTGERPHELLLVGPTRRGAPSPGARARRGPDRWPGSAIRDLDASTAPGGSGLLLVERPGAGPLSGSRASCSGEARRYYSAAGVGVIPGRGPVVRSWNGLLQGPAARSQVAGAGDPLSVVVEQRRRRRLLRA